MQRKGLLIIFTGIDGTGKTTLAKRLALLMSQNGIKTNYVMGRFQNFIILKPLFWSIKRFILSGRKTDQSAEGMKTKRALFSHRWLAGMWRWAVLLDYVIQLGYKVRLPLMLCKSISADRYVYDTVVDLAVDTTLSVAKMQKLIVNALRITSKPELVFLIDLTEDIAYQRNLAKQDNISLDYLRARRNLYLTFRNRSEVEVLDGSQKPEDLFQEILKKLKARKILV